MEGGPSSLEQYEQRLYAAWSAFEGGSGGLTRPAALALCDALQLERRGAQLVEELFARTDRVSFSQFRGGLLAALGAVTESRLSPQPPHSDDSSSGREVAPRLTVGAKRYGRRSRPLPAPPALPDTPADTALRHSAPVDAAGALQLCHSLQMDAVDRALVERIFEAAPSAGTTVGEFFDRLNAELGSMAGADVTHSGEETLPAELVLEAWEHGSVQCPRGLLHELGFGGTPALPALALEAALDRELDALTDPEARALVLQAALSLSRLRTARALHSARAAVSERTRLAADVEESESRARRVAAEADEQQARLEGELRAAARRTEQRLAEALRQAEAELAGERERAQGERAALQAEAGRRADAEGRLRGELGAARDAAEAAEARAVQAERRAEGLSRERARLLERLAASEATLPHSAPDAGREAALQQLRVDNLALRDRCDELQAQLEAPPPRAAPALPDTPLSVALHALHTTEECDSLPAAVQLPSSPQTATQSGKQSDEQSDEQLAALEAAESRHATERDKLNDMIRELEASLLAMREEYERCEEYWEGKLRAEREHHAAEQRAADERLGELLACVKDYENRFPSALPCIPEAGEDLERELTALREQHAIELARRDDELRKREQQLRQARHRARLVLSAATAGQCGHSAGSCGHSAGQCGELRGRVRRAEQCVTRLTGRLAAADLLVKQLYVENCMLTPGVANHRP